MHASLNLGQGHIYNVEVYDAKEQTTDKRTCLLIFALAWFDPSSCVGVESEG